MKFVVGFDVGIKGKRGVRTAFGSQDLGACAIWQMWVSAANKEGAGLRVN